MVDTSENVQRSARTKRKGEGMRILSLLTLVAVLSLPGSAAAQAPTEWRDPLVDRMAGTWKVEGQVMGREAHHEVRADWVLNHQFLRI